MGMLVSINAAGLMCLLQLTRERVWVRDVFHVQTDHPLDGFKTTLTHYIFISVIYQPAHYLRDWSAPLGYEFVQAPSLLGIEPYI